LEAEYMAFVSETILSPCSPNAQGKLRDFETQQTINMAGFKVASGDAFM
jgi:hypothetical protein